MPTRTTSVVFSTSVDLPARCQTPCLKRKFFWLLINLAFCPPVLFICFCMWSFHLHVCFWWVRHIWHWWTLYGLFPGCFSQNLCGKAYDPELLWPVAIFFLTVVFSTWTICLWDLYRFRGRKHHLCVLCRHRNSALGELYGAQMTWTKLMSPCHSQASHMQGLQEMLWFHSFRNLCSRIRPYGTRESYGLFTLFYWQRIRCYKLYDHHGGLWLRPKETSISRLVTWISPKSLSSNWSCNKQEVN